MKLFGNLFDFNGDGHTDAFEAAMGFILMEELSKDEEDEDESDDL